MRAVATLALGASLAWSTSASATPVPLELFGPHGEALPRRLSAMEALAKLPALRSNSPAKSTRVDDLDYDITLDPMSGVLSGKLRVTFTALNGNVSKLSLYMDSGLSVGQATAPGRTISISEQSVSGYTFATLTLSSALAAPQQLVLDVDISGTLSCGPTSMAGNCQVGTPLSYMLETSGIPAVLDQSNVGGYNAWGATRKLTLHLPSGTQAVASGDAAGASDDGQSATYTFTTPGYHSYGGFLVVMGDLKRAAVPASTPPMSINNLDSEASWQGDWVSWMTKIPGFLQQQTDKPLPFPELSLVILPVESGGFPGTAGHGITLLSASYGRIDREYFEETLAHENSHLWWGVAVSPTDIGVTRWLTEGLAVQTQYDYAAAVQYPALDREAYLARRYRENRLLLQYHTGNNFPSIVVQLPSLIPSETYQHTIWAYIKSSAVLELLRVALSDDVYAKVLRRYADQCVFQNCDSADFKAIAESESGLDLTQFFSQWVTGTVYPKPAIGFSQLKTDGSFNVSVDVTDGGNAELPLELVLTLADGSQLKKRVDVTPATNHFEFTGLPAAVRSVRENPRQNAIIWSRPAEPADRDYDREVDGFDVIHCAAQVGRSSDFGPRTEGLLGIDLRFDPLCDVNGDGAITEDELSPMLDAFGSVPAGEVAP